MYFRQAAPPPKRHVSHVVEVDAVEFIETREEPAEQRTGTRVLNPHEEPE